jgi:hypothetical protein
MNYELAISIYDNALIWISGPHPAGKQDIVVFRVGGLREKSPLGMKFIADKGYQGEKQLISIPNSFDIAEVEELKQHAQAWHESFNG